MSIIISIIIIFRIHYPLPLPYVGKPDPKALQDTIRQLRAENRRLKQSVSMMITVLSV